MTSNKIRWRAIVECKYKEVRRNHGYFHRKTYKKIIQIWDRASRLGLIDESLSDFEKRILVAMSQGIVIRELDMSISQLEKKLEIRAKWKEGAK